MVAARFSTDVFCAQHKYRFWIVPAIAIYVASGMTASVLGEERVVSNTEEFAAALEAAGPGDEIVMRPGVYGGDHYREKLDQVTIRSADPKRPAIIEGGSQGMQLSDPTNVTLRDIVFRNQELIGLNIDDGGSPETPANNITLKNVIVRDMVTEGNHDGIKLSGVDDFLIDGIQVINWGPGGSAVDMVGCHHALVQNSNFVHTGKGVDGGVFRPKGGCKDVVFCANRIQLPSGGGRAIQAGGQTDEEFFRFIDGDTGYEANQVIAEGNVVLGGSSAFCWVNIDGGIFHHNVIYRPGQWVARILNEEIEELPMVDTQNGQFNDNVIVFNDTDDEFNEAVNHSDKVLLETFRFARNRWLNLANPNAEGSRPNLPTQEAEGVYGVDPAVSIDAPQVWEFPWGKWIVNANSQPKLVEVLGFDSLRRAIEDSSARFDPLADNPLRGEWKSTALSTGRFEMPPFSQVILIDPSACPDCLSNVGN